MHPGCRRDRRDRHARLADHRDRRRDRHCQDDPERHRGHDRRQVHLDDRWSDWWAHPGRSAWASSPGWGAACQAHPDGDHQGHRHRSHRRDPQVAAGHRDGWDRSGAQAATGPCPATGRTGCCPDEVRHRSDAGRVWHPADRRCCRSGAGDPAEPGPVRPAYRGEPGRRYAAADPVDVTDPAGGPDRAACSGRSGLADRSDPLGRVGQVPPDADPDPAPGHALRAERPGAPAWPAGLCSAGSRAGSRAGSPTVGWQEAECHDRCGPRDGQADPGHAAPRQGLVADWPARMARPAAESSKPEPRASGSTARESQARRRCGRPAWRPAPPPGAPRVRSWSVRDLAGLTADSARSPNVPASGLTSWLRNRRRR